VLGVANLRHLSLDKLIIFGKNEFDRTNLFGGGKTCRNDAHPPSSFAKILLLLNV
jgi:hypothetical protein